MVARKFELARMQGKSRASASIRISIEFEWSEVYLEKTECNFNGNQRWHWLSVRSESRFAAPGLHRSNGILIEAHPNALDNPDVGDLAFDADDAFHDNRALVFHLARFIGILRRRLIETDRNSDSIDARAEHSAAGPAALAGAQTTAGAAANTAATTGATRIIYRSRQRVSHVRQRRVSHLQIGRTEQRRIHRQLGTR